MSKTKKPESIIANTASVFAFLKAHGDKVIVIRHESGKYQLKSLKSEVALIVDRQDFDFSTEVKDSGAGKNYYRGLK